MTLLAGEHLVGSLCSGGRVELKEIGDSKLAERDGRLFANCLLKEAYGPSSHGALVTEF
jgi:hypothetical protein